MLRNWSQDSWFSCLIKSCTTVLTAALLLSACSEEKEFLSDAEKAWRELELYTQNPTQYARGIDVSHWNGDIKWQEVAQDKIAFAYIKLSEGITFDDPKFPENWKGAGENGLLMGGYHVFTPGDAGVAQAKHFLNNLGSVKAGNLGALPPVLDVENVSNDNIAEMSTEIKAWLETVHKAVGCSPIIYTSAGTWDGEFPGKFNDYPLWIADYDLKPTLPTGWNSWLFWQYADNETKALNKGSKKAVPGKINGISGNVDLDFFNGSPLALLKLTCNGGL